MNSKTFLTYAGFPLLAAVGLASCASDLEQTAVSRRLPMSVSLSKGDDTRASLQESGRDLNCLWEPGDVVTVAADGHMIGSLQYKGTDLAATALFEGEVEIEGDGSKQYSFFYTGKDFPVLANDSYTVSYASQGGTLASLEDKDFFTATEAVTVTPEQVIAGTVMMKRHTAFGRFKLDFNGVEYNGETVTVTGSNLPTKAVITMSDKVTFSENEKPITTVADDNGEIFLTVLPDPEDGMETDLTFTTEIDGKIYTGKLGVHSWGAGQYVYAGEAYDAGVPSGVSVEMTPAEAPEPVDDGTVGPTFEVHGKKYRFTKGNLYYDTANKVWKIFDKQTYYIQKQGEMTDYGGTVPAEIDLFSWGATGLGNAKDPSYLRRGWANETSYPGTNWPSSNTATMDLAGNANITDLWASYGDYTEPIYDYGYAYMQSGRAAGDTRTYVTPELAAYATILDQEYSFSQGCIVKGAGIDGKDVKGALVIPGITTVEEAKAKIQSVGGTPGNLIKLSPNMNNTNFDFYITLPDYDAVEALGAWFFPLAGSGNWNSAKLYLSTDCGNYWSKNAAKGSSTEANAYCFFFRKNTSAAEFNWIVGRSGVSISRRMRCSVRLLVEVDE